MFYHLGEEQFILTDSQKEKRKWDYGYNAEIDTIIISKDGTLGSIFRVEGINIGLPAMPEPHKFKNYRKLKENQKWHRDELPAGLDDSNWFSPKYSEFVDSQYEKREHGEWIYLNGKSVWLCGTYWYFLQEYKEGPRYSKLRIIQNELMMFWEACKADERCFGMIYTKNRRFGASALGDSELLYSGTMYEDKNLGLISKKGGDAKKLFNRLVRAFKRTSPHFKVETDGNKTPKSELVFAEQNRRRSLGESVSDDEGLNTVIVWHNTELNAMDGDEIFRSLIDEGGKWAKDCPFDEYWSIVKTSHTIGEDIIGKAMVVSTVNSQNKGGKEFMTVWNQSNVDERNDNGQTQSGLYRIFIDAALGLQGYYDEYGFSIVDDPEEPFINDSGRLKKNGSDTYLKNKRKAIKDPIKLNEEIRQFPRNIREAFRDEAKDCVFNLSKIMEQIDYNADELSDDDFGNDMVTRGNFAWADGVQDSTVIWVPDKNGRFWVANNAHPKRGVGNIKIEKFRNNNLSFAPNNDGVGCFGVDPFNRSKTASGKGSMGGIHLYIKTNVLDLPNEAFVLEYIARPPKIEIFYEDVIMAMVYFSMPILPEMSSDRFSNYLIERNYRNFVMNNPFKRYKDLSPEEKRVGGVNAQGIKVREAQYQAVNTYVEEYIGIARDDSNREKGEMGFMPFNRTLYQWKDVDPDDRTEYDAYISSSLALVGCKSMIIKTVEEVEEKPVKVPFRRYDNTGITSKILL